MIDIFKKVKPRDNEYHEVSLVVVLFKISISTETAILSDHSTTTEPVGKIYEID